MFNNKILLNILYIFGIACFSIHHKTTTNNTFQLYNCDLKSFLYNLSILPIFITTLCLTFYFQHNFTILNTIGLAINAELLLMIFSYIILMIVLMKNRHIHAEFLNEIARIDWKLKNTFKITSAIEIDKRLIIENYVLIGIYSIVILNAGMDRYKLGAIDTIAHGCSFVIFITFTLIVLHIRSCVNQLKVRLRSVRWWNEQRFASEHIYVVIEFIEFFGQVKLELEKCFGISILINLLLDFVVFTVTIFFLLQNMIYENEIVFQFNNYVRISALIAFIVPPLIKCVLLAVALDSFSKEV